MYDYRCDSCGKVVERYVHNSINRDDINEDCEGCSEPFRRILSLGFGLTCFRENKGEWIENIGPKPEYITSHGAWREALKRNNREWVGARRGEKGCWA